METYEMKFKCANCGSIFIAKISKGTVAKGNGGACPYCGCVDMNPKTFESIPIHEKAQILLEGEDVFGKKNS